VRRVLKERTEEIRHKVAVLERARSAASDLERQVEAAAARNAVAHASGVSELTATQIRVELLERSCEDLRERVETARADARTLRLLEQRLVCAADAAAQRCSEREIELRNTPEQTHPAHIENLQRVVRLQDSELLESRRKLLESLLCFFPLNPVSETHHRIVNITLPNDSNAYFELDADIVSAALGHAARLLCAASTYLSVPLLHRISLCGSRTRVGERADGPWYPLHSAGGVTRDAFAHALQLFNENIVWVSWAQGIEEPSHHPSLTLPNLLAAFRNKNGLQPQRSGPQFGGVKDGNGRSGTSTTVADVEDEFVVI
jgi:hypothetical protein